MRLTKDKKQAITQRIRSAAAKQFRALGYDAVSLDVLMKEAGLTRGAFYAHYPSKAALFADVLREEHPLLAMLTRRDGKDAEALHRQMVAIFAGYLDPANQPTVFEGCTLAALTGDATRADDAGRAAFGDAVGAFLAEMARGQENPSNAYQSALVLAAGAVRTAAACHDQTLKRQLLTASWAGFQTLLPRSQGKQQ